MATILDSTVIEQLDHLRKVYPAVLETDFKRTQACTVLREAHCELLHMSAPPSPIKRD